MAMCLAVVHLLGFLAGSFLPGGQGPVQHPSVARAAEDFDFTTCVQCHATKSAGKVVHPALQMGCGTCHAVEQDEDDTRIVLTTKENDLCFACHDDKRPQPTQLLLHKPLRTERCASCHEPHSSPNAHLLRQPTESLESATNLCLKCHSEIQVQIQKPVRHAAVDMGCASCHVTHKSEPSGAPEGVFHLSRPLPQLCLDCHNASDPALQAAHLNQPFAGARCSECHNPHGSDSAKLLNAYVHPPFAEKHCEMCHEPPTNGTVVLVEGARRELCLGCHAEVQERLEKAKVTHTAVAGQAACVSCHSPHASNYAHQTRRRPVELCLDCHTELAKAQVEKSFLHRPAFDMSCLICHSEHAGERPQRLRAETSDLCLECHGSQNAGKFQAPGTVKLFGATVEVDAARLAGMRILSIAAGSSRGHPFGNHPLPTKGSGDCLTCHLPHAANGSPKLLVTETLTSTPLCVRCHK